MFIGALFVITPVWKESKCPSAAEGGNCRSHGVELPTVMQRSSPQIHATARINHKHNIRGKRPDPEEFLGFHLYKVQK